MSLPTAEIRGTHIAMCPGLTQHASHVGDLNRLITMDQFNDALTDLVFKREIAPSATWC
ncbi:MAG: hypothetical protein Ct9H300mP7_3060 [Verrucomicrobiota bacterium]|nr:MAG: hypothetical protein Ct9H300mP7_3060 [Verrucomicrobiota bacterium]